MTAIHSDSHERLVDEREAAVRLCLSVRTLQAWRVKGGGPPFVRLGRAVRYRPADVAAWIDRQTLLHTSGGGR